MRRIVGGTVNINDGKPYFLSDDERNLPLSVQSSGTLELLPMFNVVNQLAFFQEHIYARAAATKISPIADISEHNPLVYVEEPEAHLFPKAQYQLIQLFAWLANDPVLNFDWVITTHSPYILSSFNNLIEAGQVARAKPESKEDVAKLIPEQYWIKEGDFKGYAIEDRVLKSIVAEDTGLVSTNYLDSVSETIGVEFDELLRLGYVES
jgi:AAA ATPase-like protein